MKPTYLPLVIFFISLFGNSLLSQTEKYRRDSFIEFDVFFKTDQYGLESTEITKLNGLIQAVKSHDKYEIYLKGQADFRGSDGYNDTLSSNRVRSVYNYLLGSDIDEATIKTTVIGEVPNFLKINDPDKELRRDRKVSIEARMSLWFTLKKPEPKVEIVYVEKGEKDCADQDTILNFDDGIFIEVPGCAFKCNHAREMQFDIQFVNTQQEMLRERLPTVSDQGECLQTAGMLFIDINDERGCATTAREPLKVYIPTENFEITMELWSSVRGLRNQVESWTSDGKYPEKAVKNGRNYYVVEITSSINFNLDKPMGTFAVIQEAPRPFFKVRRFKKKNTEAFLSGSRSNFPGQFYKKRKFYFTNVSCIPEDERYVSLFSEKKGKTFVYHMPIEQLRRQKWWFIGKGDRFLIRKRDYKRIYSEVDMDKVLTASSEGN